MPRFDRDEARSYWRALHRTDPRPGDAERFDVVCRRGMPVWFNRYVARCQERAFDRALTAVAAAPGARVLDVGCGTGRWSRRLRDDGARVTGIDVSEAAVALARERVEGVEFLCADVAELDLPPGSFDLAVSVTVLAHLPLAAQEQALDRLATAIRAGGSLILLENVHDQTEHVFSRSPDGWKVVAAARGFELASTAGYGYDIPLRTWYALRRATSKRTATSASAAAGPARSRVASIVYRPLVALSYVLEPVSALLLPDSWATHCAFVFRRAP